MTVGMVPRGRLSLMQILMKRSMTCSALLVLALAGCSSDPNPSPSHNAPSGKYTGTAQFDDGSGTHYTATVTWTEFNSGDDTTRAYAPSGTIVADITHTDCATAHATATIDGLGSLLVHSASNASTPSSYEWSAESDSVDVAFTCKGGNFTSSQQFFFKVGGCAPNDFPALADEAHLASTFKCAAANVTWDFKVN